VEGTDEFRVKVAQLAGMHGLKVTFSDPAMEQMRRETAEHKEMEKSFQAEIRAQKDTNDIAAHRLSRGRTADLL